MLPSPPPSSASNEHCKVGEVGAVAVVVQERFLSLPGPLNLVSDQLLHGCPTATVPPDV